MRAIPPQAVPTNYDDRPLRSLTGTLDSGVQRFGAHRFSLGKGMDITCHHFDLRLSSRLPLNRAPAGSTIGHDDDRAPF